MPSPVQLPARSAASALRALRRAALTAAVVTSVHFATTGCGPRDGDGRTETSSATGTPAAPVAPASTNSATAPRPGGSDTVQRRVEPKAVALLDRYVALLDSPANAGVRAIDATAVIDLGFRDAHPTLLIRWTPESSVFTAKMPAEIDEMMPPEMIVPVTKTMSRLVGDRFVAPLLGSLLPDLRDYEILHRESGGRPIVKLFAVRAGPAWDRLEIAFDDAGLISSMTGTVRTDKDDPLTSAYGGASDVKIEAAHARRGDRWVLTELRIAATAGRWDATIEWHAGTTRPSLPSVVRYTNSLMPGDRTVTFASWNVDGRVVPVPAPASSAPGTREQK